jgi:hypothetical protein
MSQVPHRQSQDPADSQLPSRFQVTAPAQGSPSVVRRVGLFLALVALVVGVPALLVGLSGPPPIPTSLPGREDLTSSIGMEQVLTVLVAIVWLAWLQFVTCLIVELFSTVRREGVPTPVPFSGPSQRLARALVGGLLLAGVVGGQVATVMNAMGADGARSATTISATAQPGQPGAQSASPQTGQGAYVVTRAGVGLTAQSSGLAQAAESEQSSTPLAPAGKRIYTVKAPVGHSHESLWQIAERHLGDGRRYKEIFVLNEGVPQSDGSAMHLARMIQPGWQLVMPEDAVGVARFVPPPAIPVTPLAPLASWGDAGVVSTPDAVTVSHDTTAPTEDAMAAVGAPRSRVTSSGASQVDQASHVDQAAQVSQAAQPDQTVRINQAGKLDETAHAMVAPVNPLIAGLATSGLFGACLLSALLIQRARRRGGAQPGEDALEAEIGLRVGADLDRARWLDSALRNLAATCAETGLRLPPVYAARVDDERLELLLAPARTNAPDPWSVADEGRRWVLQRRDSPRVATAGPAAYPALVCLGRDEQGRDALVDLEASGGPVQITGDAVIASQVAAALAIQLATMPWSDTVRVSALGLPAELSNLAGARINAISDLEPVVAGLESRGTGIRDDILTGRLSRVQDEAPEYIILAEPISEGLSGRVAAVTAGSRHPFGVVAVGTIPGAQWRLEVDEAGSLTLPLLALSVRAHRLLPRTQQAVVDLFEAADTEAPAQASGRVDIPSTLQSIDDAAYAAAPVRVGILGPIAVRAEGPMDPSRVPLAAEVVTYLAAHPGGVHPSVLAAAIWPRGVTHTVATATIDRVRDWLGDDADGAARLRTDETGRYLLAPGVAVDWHSLCTLLLRSRSAGAPKDEAELLRRALRLVRGPVLQDRPATRYTWLVRTPLERTIETVVIDAAHRLAQISSELSDPGAAAEAVLSGLRMAPTAQLLWRDLLEAEHQSGGVSALHAAVADMQETMDRSGTRVDAETEALIEHLTSLRTATGA